MKKKLRIVLDLLPTTAIYVLALKLVVYPNISWWAIIIPLAPTLLAAIIILIALCLAIVAAKLGTVVENFEQVSKERIASKRTDK